MERYRAALDAGADPAVVTGWIAQTQTGRARAELEALPAGLRGADVVSLSIEAVEDLLIRYRLAGHPPDLLIEIPTDACRSYEFHRAPEMIEVGRRAAGDALASSGFAR